MVRLTAIQCGVMRTFGYHLKGNQRFLERQQLKHKKFASNLDPEKILERNCSDQQNLPKERTFRDAQQSMVRKDLILPNLSPQDLETNSIFQTELDRQRAIIARIDKIRVIVDSVPGNGAELFMNKYISTPYDCARHIHELVTTRSVVAEILPADTSTQIVDRGSNPTDESSEDKLNVQKVQQQKPLFWDMHRPLEGDCKIRFRHFCEKNVEEINKIYWRSCSFVLGLAIRLAFKDGIKVILHSWPRPNVRSGSFLYDVALNLDKIWEPSEQELMAFTKVMWNIKAAALPIDRLQVDREVARKLFAHNPFKLAQIDSILDNEVSQGKVTVYRCGGLLDISVGPMISNTSHIGRITLASVHSIESDMEMYKGIFYRFQGVSLPQQLPLSSFLYQNVLINQAKNLNKASL